MASKEIFAFLSLKVNHRLSVKETDSVINLTDISSARRQANSVHRDVSHSVSHYCQPSQKISLRSILLPQLWHTTTPKKVPTPFSLHLLSLHLLLPPRQRHPLLPSRNKKRNTQINLGQKEKNAQSRVPRFLLVADGEDVAEVVGYSGWVPEDKWDKG